MDDRRTTERDASDDGDGAIGGPRRDDRRSGRVETDSDGRVTGIEVSNGDAPQSAADGERAARSDARDGERRDQKLLGGLVAEEDWSPPGSAVRDAAAVRQYLTARESLRFVDAAVLIEERPRPAAVGLTDERLLAVTGDGGFVGVGLDRICSVRSDRHTSLGVRGTDARVPLAAGFLLAIVGFLGVLAGAANPLTPTLAVAAVGGALATDYVRRESVDWSGVLAAIRRADGDSSVADRLERLGRRIDERAGGETVTLAAAGALALLPFLAVVALEPGLIAPAWTVVTAAGALLTVRGFRHADDLADVELVRRRERTVRATVEDGSTITVRTRPDSTLDRVLSGLVDGSPAVPERDGGG